MANIPRDFTWKTYGPDLNGMYQGLRTGASNSLGKVFSVVYDIRDRPIQVTGADGVTVTQTFDLFNRLLSRGWPDGGSEGFLYSTNGLVAYTNQLAAVTWFTNDAAYRLVARRDANNHVVRFSYNAASDLLALTDGNGKTTGWLLDSFGQVLAKTNGLNQLVFTNAFNADYQLTKHWTPEKGLTTLVYDEVHNLRQRQPAGEMTILYDFDALNRLTNVVDYVGTNRLTYTAAGQVLTEDGPWASDTITYGYTQQQRTSLSLLQPSAPAWSLTYSYESARRLQTLTSPAGAFTYGYTPGLASSRPIQNWLPTGASATNHYDLVARLDYTALLDSWGHVLDGYSYIHDRSGLRTNITRDFGLGISTVSVGSDPIGQITSWTGRESNGVLRLNEQLGYGYNPSDNLNSRTNGALVQTFTIDGANELTNISRTGAMTLTGATPAPASSVTVNGQTAQTYADFAFARTNNTLANGQNTFTIIAQAASGLKVTNNLSVNLPATATLQYDRNGNLTNDGIRSFSFDAANQLTNITIAGVSKSEFIHDGLSRRRIMREYSWSGSAWQQTNETHLVYDGMQIIQERDSNNNPQDTYTRGLDLSGSRTGAGGIGGLLARTDLNGSAFYHADGGGNVTALMDPAENIAGRYLYGPFGNSVGRWGSLAAANAMQSSSMPHHNPSGLILYPFRPYEPNLQRFISSDPIGERGGINLYGFVGNSPISRVDPLGLAWYDYVPGIGPGIAQARGEAAIQAQLARYGYGSMQEFQLDHPGYGGTTTSGNLGAVQATANIAGGAADLYLMAATSVTPTAAGTRCVARLTQQGLEHIAGRHLFTTGAKNAGKFAEDIGARAIRDLIDDAVANGASSPSRFGRTVFEYDFGRVLGTDIVGNSATRLRVVVESNGDVVTAFPIR